MQSGRTSVSQPMLAELTLTYRISPGQYEHIVVIGLFVKGFHTLWKIVHLHKIVKDMSVEVG